MTNKTLWVSAALAVVGIGVVAVIAERTSPPARTVVAPDLPVETNPVSALSADLVSDSPEPTPAPIVAAKDAPGTDRQFGETVAFTVAYVCDDAGSCRYRPAPQHEYASYSQQQLETIAGFDGAAAIILANRLGASDVESAKRWAVQGFLLTGDAYAFHMASLYSGVAVGATLDANGELDRKAAEEAYIWLKLGHELGVADASNVREQAQILKDYRAFDPKRLDAEVDARLAKLIEDRVRLTGRTF